MSVTDLQWSGMVDCPCCCWWQCQQWKCWKLKFSNFFWFIEYMQGLRAWKHKKMCAHKHWWCGCCHQQRARQDKIFSNSKSTEMLWEAKKCAYASRCINFESTYFVRWQRQIIGLFTPVYALKALIANLLAIKGLTGLRPRLRAHVKGLIIIIDLICNLLRSPQSHLYQNITILSAVAKTKLSNCENGK
jgi:hypothetical protein